VFGDEETRAIIPALEAVRQDGYDVSGPHSADALFGRIHNTPCDAVVTMYHDQGMIPIKMASLGKAVNITLGLPILRTSVDHGTAYDIAGRGMASPDSLVEAMRMAATLSKPASVPS
jgi:4-hydroxythreonine-4-phosphate dehydrogenase